MPCFVYITTNANNTVLYTGVTRDLAKRMMEHRQGPNDGFTKKHKVYKLVYFEMFEDVKEAIRREKQIKVGSRKKKIDLISKLNRDWEDLTKNL
jgi:putative endonuclease